MSTTQQVYSVEDLHISINDIYGQFHSEKITLEMTRELMLACCQEFVKHHNVNMLNALVSMDKFEMIFVGGKK